MNAKVLKKIVVLLVICSSFFTYAQNKQSRLFPAYDKYIDMETGNVSLLPFNYTGLSGVDVEDWADAHGVTLDENYYYLGEQYCGQNPEFAQTIVYDNDNCDNIRFFIVDNIIYNKNGRCFSNLIYNGINYQYDIDFMSVTLDQQVSTSIQDDINTPYGSSIPLWAHTDWYVIRPWMDGNIFRQNKYNSGLNDGLSMGNKILVVPTPGKCNEYYIIYTLTPSLEDNMDKEAEASGVTLFRKLTYIDDNTIEMSDAYNFDYVGSVNAPISGSGSRSTSYSVSDLINNGNGDYRILFYFNNSDIFTYRIDANGINSETFNFGSGDVICTPYPNNLYRGIHYIYNNISEHYRTGELEVVKVFDTNIGDYCFYTAYPYYKTNLQANTSESGVLLSKFDLNGVLLNQNINDGIYKIVLNTSNDYQDLHFTKGLEFSPNGEYLYFNNSGITGIGIGYISTSNLANNLYNTVTTPNFIGSAITENYKYSQIELGYDGKLYYANNSGTLSTLSNPNNPSGNNFIVNAVSNVNMPLRLDYLNRENQKTIFFMNQIDGEDYIVHYTNATCIECNFYTSINKTYNNDQNNDDTEDIVIDNISSSPTYGLVTVNNAQGNINWTPQNNPFTCDGTADIYLKNDIIINEGSSLTLQNLTIRFTEGHGVKVLKGSATDANHRGAKFIIINTTLTADDRCGKDATIIWKGVELIGDNSSQTIANTKQPRIDILAGSIIEYAEWGAKSHYGGIIIASNSTFKDNIYATRFSGYNFADQISSFTKCTFKTTEAIYTEKKLNYNSGVYPNYYNLTYPTQVGDLFPLVFSSIWLDKNIKYYGNTFINEYNPANYRGSGIDVFQGSIKVDRKCDGLGYNGQCFGEHKTHFENLKYGIKINDCFGNSIKNSEFAENKYGTLIIGTDNIVIVNNDYNVINSGNEVYGLSIESSTGYIIQNNQFHDGVAGMYVINSGDLSQDMIRRNQFYNLTNNGNQTGLIVNGVNGDYIAGNTFSYEGLSIPCNKFDNNDYAIAVIDGNMAKHQVGFDISTNQATGPSANWLDHNNNVGGETDFIIEDNGSFGSMVDDYLYLQHPYTSAQELRLDFDNNPSTYITHNTYDMDYYTYNTLPSLPTISVSPDFSDGDKYTWQAACPDAYPTGGGIRPFDPIVSHTIAMSDDFSNQAVSLKDELNSKIDGGNTIALQTEVDNLSNQNYFSVCADLLEVGQYLSNDVLISFMENDIMRPVAKTAVLMANSPLPVAIKNKIDDLNIPPPFKWYLKQLQNGTYQREQDQMQVSGLESGSSYLTNKAIAFAMSNDSVPEKLDSIITWLDGKTDIKSYYNLSGIYFNKGEYQNAALATNNLIAEAQTIGGQTLVNAENYKTIQQINYQIIQNPENEKLIISSNIKELQLIAHGEGKQAGIARYMLYHYDSKKYPSYKQTYPLPNITNKSMALQQNKPSDNYTGKMKAMISVYPNPTDGQLNVEYINFEGASNINIYDMQGKIVMTFNANKDFGFATYDVSSLNKGNYLIGFGKNQTTQFIVK